MENNTTKATLKFRQLALSDEIWEKSLELSNLSPFGKTSRPSVLRRAIKIGLKRIETAIQEWDAESTDELGA